MLFLPMFKICWLFKLVILNIFERTIICRVCTKQKKTLFLFNNLNKNNFLRKPTLIYYQCSFLVMYSIIPLMISACNLNIQFNMQHCVQRDSTFWRRQPIIYYNREMDRDIFFILLCKLKLGYYYLYTLIICFQSINNDNFPDFQLMCTAVVIIHS